MNRTPAFKRHTVRLSIQRKVQQELNKMYQQIGDLFESGETEKAQELINEIVKVRQAVRMYNVVIK